MEIYFVRFLYYIWNSINYLKIDCDNLMVYTINPKATTKISKQRPIYYNPTKEGKRSKHFSVNWKESKKEKNKN